jgi:hypothetical protein
MTTYQITVIGEFHTNHNKDSLFSSKIGKNKIFELETENGLKPSDDLTIIRVIATHA